MPGTALAGALPQGIDPSSRTAQYLQFLPELRLELGRLDSDFRLRLSLALVGFLLWLGAVVWLLLPAWPASSTRSLVLGLLAAVALYRGLRLAFGGLRPWSLRLIENLAVSELARRVADGALEQDTIFNYAPRLARPLLYFDDAGAPLVQLRRLVVHLGWYLAPPQRLLDPLALLQARIAKYSLWLLWLFPLLLILLSSRAIQQEALLYGLALPGLWLCHLALMSAGSLRYVEMGGLILCDYLEQQWRGRRDRPSTAPGAKRPRRRRISC